jgi:hypothetical protein
MNFAGATNGDEDNVVRMKMTMSLTVTEAMSETVVGKAVPTPTAAVHPCSPDVTMQARSAMLDEV